MGSIGDIHALKKALLKIDDELKVQWILVCFSIPKGVENPTDWCLQNWGTRENAIEIELRTGQLWLRLRALFVVFIQ